LKKIKKIKKMAASADLINIFRLAKGESILYTIICAKSLSPGNQQMKDVFVSSHKLERGGSHSRYPYPFPQTRQETDQTNERNACLLHRLEER
jgi:hypothetical protein